MPKLSENVAATKMHWYATVFFKNDNKNDNNEDFNTAVKEISSLKREITKLTGDDIKTNFLTLPSVITVTFKIIQQ